MPDDPAAVLDAPDTGQAPPTNAAVLLPEAAAASDADAAPTPVSWRLLAAGALGGGFALGYRSTTGAGTRGVVLAAVGGALASSAPMAWASRRPPIEPRGHDAAGRGGDVLATGPTFTVVVACRDEAAVLPRLVRDIAGQDHRSDDGDPLFELVVIDDRSLDGTAEVAARAAVAAGIAAVTRVVRRDGDVPDGKGAALTALSPEAYRGDVVVVLDADARVGRDFLSSLAHYVDGGARAVTARRRILDARSSWLAGAQADEQTLDGELQRGRWALGGLSEFRGNGIVVARDLLLDVGGWRAQALTEDLDLSSRIAAAHGIGVAWALDAEVWEEPVRSWPALWRQRVRWAEGALRRLLEHGPAVVRSRRLGLRAKVDFAAYGGQIAAPPLILGAVAGAVRRSRPGTATALVAAYAGVAGALAWDALRWETAPTGDPLPGGERRARAARAAAFGSLWLAAVPAAMWRLAARRGAVVYDKMAHGRDARPADAHGAGRAGAHRGGAPVS